jgi:hypothetical protein
MLAFGLRNLGLAIFFGGGLAVLAGTRAIFGLAESRALAGRFSGGVLHAFAVLRAAALVLLFFAALLDRFGGVVLALLFGLFVAGAYVDRRIRALREAMGGSTEGLDPADPRRKQWGALHGGSVLLLIAQVAIAGFSLALR